MWGMGDWVWGADGGLGMGDWVWGVDGGSGMGDWVWGELTWMGMVFETFLEEMLMALRSYRDLEVWEVSMQLVEAVYRMVEQLPESEKFGLMSQLRRASVSVPANIAEGYGRAHRAEYLQHLSIARGSLLEVETLLTLCVRLNMIDRDAMLPVWELAQSVGKLLAGLQKSLRK